MANVSNNVQTRRNLSYLGYLSECFVSFGHQSTLYGVGQWEKNANKTLKYYFICEHLWQIHPRQVFISTGGYLNGLYDCLFSPKQPHSAPESLFQS